MLSGQVRPEEIPSAESDADLIELSLREPARFGVIYDRHAAEILRYAHARLGPSSAEEVMAETFLAAFRRRDKYDCSRSDARPWLYGIATRQISKHRRTEGRHQRALARLHAEAASEDFADRSDDRVTAQGLRPRIATVLAGMSQRDRDLLLLIAWAGLSYDETARALGIPIGTVRSRLNHIRTHTREALGGANPARATEGHQP
ncbi:MAG TPA: RNA polymerase sigma factor [Streptosporangiaceae bacterium]